MIAYNNPEIHLLDLPVGLDAEIQAIQIKLGTECPWLQKVFGRAIRQQLTSVGEKSIYYPECYSNGFEPINVMPNDNLTSLLFFYVNDPRRAGEDYQAFEENLYISPVSLIVWADMSKVLQANISQRRTEELIRSVTNALGKATSVKITSIFEGWENVYNNYSITEEYRQYMKPPYTAFRIDFDLSFIEECLI